MRRCPLGCANADIVLAIDNFKFFKCQDCGLVFISPVPTKSELDKIYNYEHKSNKYDQLVSTLNPGLALVLKNGITKNLLAIWSQRVSLDRVHKAQSFQPTGSVADIGCGPGLFLSGMKQHGYEIWGTEIGDKLIKIASTNTSSTNIVKGKIENIKIPKVNMITFWHVLEHIADYDSTINAASKLLKKDGGLIIEVPHGSSINFSLFKFNWTLLLLPQHLFLWTRKSLDKMLKKHGLVVERVEYPNHFPFVFLSSFVKINPAFVYLTPIMLPLTFIVTIISGYLGLGDIIRVYARKT